MKKKWPWKKKRGQEEQKKYEEKIEIKNRKEIEKLIEQQKKKEIERQKELEREKENQKKKEIELQKQREKEIKMGIQQEIEKHKEIMKQKELDEKNKKMKQIKINKVTQVNLKSLVDNTHINQKIISRNIEKDKEKALKLIKKYILFRGNYLLKLRKYFNDWKIIVKNLQLKEYAKAIQEFCRGNLEISSIKRGIKNWKNLSRKIFYKKRIKLLKMRSKYDIKKKKLYQLIKITKLHRIFSRRRFIHYIVLIWYIYAKNIHKKKVNMKFLYENLLRTYMSLAKDIFGNNQLENPSVQDAMYEAVNTDKFQTSYFDDVPLARKHYEEMKRKKLKDMKNKEYSSSNNKIEVGKKVIVEETGLSIDEQRKKELLNKFRKYKSMNRDLILEKKNRYIKSIEKDYEERKNNTREISEDKSYKNINNKYDHKVNNISTRMNLDNNNKYNNDNIYSYNKVVGIKSYTKPVENKYNINNSSYNSINYNKGQKTTEIREYKQSTDNSKYNNTSYPSRKNKSENKDNIINNITTTTSKYTTSQNQKYTTSNKPSTSVDISVQSYGKGTSNNSNIETYKSTYKKEVNTQGNYNKITPNYTTYKKTEVTTYKKEESKPLVGNITTKYETTKNTGNNNIITSNISVVTSSYNNIGTYKDISNKTGDKNKLNMSQNTKAISGYQTNYIKTEGNIKDKQSDNKYVTKIERKVEIKTSGSSDKDRQGNKPIFKTKSYVSSKINH